MEPNAEVLEAVCEAAEEVPWRKVVERGRELLAAGGDQCGNQTATRGGTAPAETGKKTTTNQR
jgi:hypothetical protein